MRNLIQKSICTKFVTFLHEVTYRDRISHLSMVEGCDGKKLWVGGVPALLNIE